jgi:hypothetical protein
MNTGLRTCSCGASCGEKSTPVVFLSFNHLGRISGREARSNPLCTRCAKAAVRKIRKDSKSSRQIQVKAAG